MNQSRQQNHRVKIGVKNDGTIMAMDAEILFDMGGYTRTHGGVPAIAASAMLRGPFRIKNYRCNVFCVLTNKTPVGTYRSPGRYEANFVRERLMDIDRASFEARSRGRTTAQSDSPRRNAL